MMNESPAIKNIRFLLILDLMDIVILLKADYLVVFRILNFDALYYMFLNMS